MRREQYVRDNLRLVETPLQVFAPALAEDGGAVVFVSSSFVQDTPAGFSHYVAVKQAGESLLRTVVRERPQLAGLIARPPVLQTRWNDTPSGVLGSIPADWAAAHIVNHTAARWTAGAVHLLSEFPPFEARRDAAPARAPELSIRVAASFTTDPLLPALRFWVKELALDAAVDVAPYGQVLQSLLDPSSLLNARGRGANVVLLRVRDWLRELPDGSRRRHRARPAVPAADGRTTSRPRSAPIAARRASRRCSSSARPTARASSAESILVRQTEDAIAAALAGVPGLQVVPAVALPRPLRGGRGRGARRAARRHRAHPVSRRLPARARGDRRRATSIGASRRCARSWWSTATTRCGGASSAKWAPEGVEFDAGHRALHALLGRLTESGVLRVPVQQERRARRVARVRDPARLRPPPRAGRGGHDQLAAQVAEPPHAGRAAQPRARQLRLHRRQPGRVRRGAGRLPRSAHPPVAAGARARRAPARATSGNSTPARPPRKTRAAPRCTRRSSSARRLRAETLTFEDFIESLQLEVDFAPLSAEDLRRSAQLTLRTNQFNFTTIRREEADVQALAAGGRHEIRTVRVRDRFGDYGLVGLVIAERGAGRVEPRHVSAELPRARPRRRAPASWPTSGAMARGGRCPRREAARRDDQAQHAGAVVPRVDRPGRPASGRRARGRGRCAGGRAGAASASSRRVAGEVIVEDDGGGEGRGAAGRRRDAAAARGTDCARGVRADHRRRHARRGRGPQRRRRGLAGAGGRRGRRRRRGARGVRGGAARAGRSRWRRSIGSKRSAATRCASSRSPSR